MWDDQIANINIPWAKTSNGYKAFVLVPERNSISTKNDSDIVKKYRTKLHDNGILTPKVKVIGKDPDTSDPCKC